MVAFSEKVHNPLCYSLEKKKSFYYKFVNKLKYDHFIFSI